jgi:hydrogenase/urease accessory protein HupE
MAEAVYLLCAVASAFCAVLLGTSYRRNPTRLLMWSTLCFVGLTINNVLLFIDVVLVPEIDLSLVRSLTALGSVLLLLIGLLWEEL